MPFYLFLLIQLSLFTSCMTLQLNYLTSPKKVETNLDLNSSEPILYKEEDMIRFNINNSDHSNSFKNCLSLKVKQFNFCKENLTTSPQTHAFIKDSDFFVEGKKGFIFFNHAYAFIHEKMIRNTYDDGNGQFGFPKSISISEDGNSRLITYYKPRKDLNDVCYFEELNTENNRFQFKTDCNKLKANIKFKPMKMVKLPKAIYISIPDKKSNSMYARKIFINQNSKENLFIPVDSILGQKTKTPNFLLYLLYPPAIIFDIITFPIQILIFPLAKQH